MQLALAQLATCLGRGLRPLYVLTGDEPLLISEAQDAIRAAARHEGYAERCLFTAEGNFDWSQVRAEAQATSLFAARRVLDLRLPTGKPGTAGAQFLQEHARALPPELLTLLTLPRLDRTAQSSKWFQALDAAGAVINVPPVERRQLPAWLAERLARQQQSAEAETLAWLADRVEGNLLAARQEVIKLGLLFPPGALAAEDVRRAVLDVARFDVFQLGDAVLAGDLPRVSRVLMALEDEGVAAALVLWALTQEIRTLLRLKIGLRTGGSLPQLLRDARVWASRKTQTERALGGLTLPRLRQALLAAARADRVVKGLEPGETWDTLLQVALTIARPLAPRPTAGRTRP